MVIRPNSSRPRCVMPMKDGRPRRCSSARHARPNCFRTIPVASPARCVCRSRSFRLSSPLIRRKRTGRGGDVLPAREVSRSRSVCACPRLRRRCNILGPTALGFRHRDDVREISGILQRLGVEICVTAPLGAAPEDIARLGEADFNVVLYPEIALPAAKWLEKNHQQPFTQTIPIGVGATRAFIRRGGQARRGRSRFCA